MNEPAIDDATLESGFLSKHPQYRSVIARAPELVRQRLSTAVRQEDPFPHVWVEQLLPDDASGILADAWPPADYFWSDRPNRLDLVPKPRGINPSDARTDGYDRLPACIREVWDAFIIDINRRVVGPFLEQLFRPEIEARLALLGTSTEHGLPLAQYLRPPFVAQMNVGRFMVRGYGYQLRPHVDALAYLATALFYFPQSPDERDALGTTLYRVERELPLDSLLQRGKTEYFHGAGIAASPARVIPFAGNALLAFANTGRSAHGMHMITPGVWRRAFQSHLSLKNDSDHL